MKPFSMWLGLVGLASAGLACDFCSVYLGLQPNDYRSNVRLTYRSLTVGADMPVWEGPKHLDASGRLREFYEQVQVTGQYYWRDVWRFSGQTAYHLNTQYLNRRLRQQGRGMGDLYLQADRLVTVSRADRPKRAFYHRVFAGLGVTLPVGSTNASFNGETVERDFQPGDGVLLLTPNVAVALSKGPLALQWQAQYTAALNAAAGHQPGQAWTQQFALFWQAAPAPDWTLTPMVTAAYESRSADQHDHQPLADTGGWQVLAGAGLAVRYKHYELQGMYQHLSSHKLIGNQAPAIRNWRLECRIYFSS